MAHDHLRQSPIYQRALRVPHVMGNLPPDYRMRKYENRDNERVRSAALRLDHLIRNAFDLDAHEHLCRHIVCAIKAWVRFLDRTLPTMNLEANSRTLISERIEFCRQIAAASDQERVPFGWEPLDSQYFEDVVTKGGGTMASIVYSNPFWGQSAGPTYNGGSLNNRFFDFYYDMRCYWE